jgi:hypothetical protein
MTPTGARGPRRGVGAVRQWFTEWQWFTAPQWAAVPQCFTARQCAAP